MTLDLRIDRENVLHLHNGVLRRKKSNDIMKLVGKQMELEYIILDEVTRTQKDNYHMYSLISGSQTYSKVKTVYNSQSQRT